jgi:hypothetical protein
MSTFESRTLYKSSKSTFFAIEASISDLFAFRWRACATDYLLAFSFSLSSISTREIGNSMP